MPMFNGQQLDSYNEEKALDAYITYHLSKFLTDFEQRAIRLAGMREKAKGSKAMASSLSEMIAKESEQVVVASSVGYDNLRLKIKDRVLDAVHDGELSINRCPKCNRIVRTPTAQQCLWCGHDWHHFTTDLR
jgi:hypothetical protein